MQDMPPGAGGWSTRSRAPPSRGSRTTLGEPLRCSSLPASSTETSRWPTRISNPGSRTALSAWALPTLAVLRARRGDSEATPLLEEAQGLLESTAELMQIVPVAVARAEAAWLAGDNAAVAAVTESPLTLALERDAPWPAGELAYWRWQAGSDDALPEDALAEPYRLAIAGEWAAAAKRWSAIGCPYETALALAESDDQQTVRDAVVQLKQLGARPAAALITRRSRARGMRGLPRGPRSSTRANLGGLTDRGLEVLLLVAQGLRNAEIAERLIVSEKTIDHHVSAILRKLGARTRVEASVEAARLGLT